MKPSITEAHARLQPLTERYQALQKEYKELLTFFDGWVRPNVTMDEIQVARCRIEQLKKQIPDALNQMMAAQNDLKMVEEAEVCS